MNIPRTLKDDLRAGRVIPFVGAGVSIAVCQKESGEPLFPSWRELLMRAADRLKEENKTPAADLVRALLNYDDGSEYLRAAEYARKGLGSTWFTFLREQLDPPRSRADDSSLRLAESVWNLGSQLVITTNYDRVLHWACPNHDDLSSWYIQAAVEQREALSQTVQRPTVWHLHGYIDDLANVILTPDGYTRLYPDAGKAEDRYGAALATLRNMLISHRFLFIGFSLDDPYFGMQLQGIDAVFQNATGPHFALVHDATLERFEEHKNQKALPIDAITFTEHGEPLLELLSGLTNLGAVSSKNVMQMTLDISEPGLEIYLTGKKVAWGKSSQLRYEAAAIGYLLAFRKADVGDEEFKHLVVCDEADSGRIKEILTREGFVVTGESGNDDEPGTWRIWFLHPDYPITEDDNNRW
jgi:hypothetical protein